MYHLSSLPGRFFIVGAALHPPKLFSWQRMKALGHLPSSKNLDIFDLPSVGQAWLPTEEQEG